jgi:tRNA-dihydrouridine synthase B
MTRKTLDGLPYHGGVFLAPMEDVTDISFRIICKRFGADMVFTEFVNADGLVRSKKPTKTFLKMQMLEEERPVGIQLYGGDIETMRPAARIVEAQNPDVVDINAGCWVRKIATRGAGAGLLRNLPLLVETAADIVKLLELPVTVKTRIGWDSGSIQIVELSKMLEDVGVQALTVHCRTRQQGHSGDADWSWIPRVKNAVNIPVILNGGVFTAEDAKRAFDTTGCDGVMIARGAIANPFLFREIRSLLDTGIAAEPPSMRERLLTAVEHLRLAVEYKGERRAVLEMRKYYAGYLKGLPFIKPLRMALMVPLTFTEVEDIILLFLERAESDPCYPGHHADTEPAV